MLFKFLSLFGHDIPAMMDSVKAGLDLRFEHAKDGFTRMAVQVAVIAALLVFAAIAGAMAGWVALLALYQWTAEEAGVYAGLGAVGAALIVVVYKFLFDLSAPGDRRGVGGASPLRGRISDPPRPRAVRLHPRGCGRSVGRGVHRPAIEPRNK